MDGARHDVLCGHHGAHLAYQLGVGGWWREALGEPRDEDKRGLRVDRAAWLIAAAGAVGANGEGRAIGLGAN